jgi:hypothetical protein
MCKSEKLIIERGWTVLGDHERVGAAEIREARIDGLRDEHGKENHADTDRRHGLAIELDSLRKLRWRGNKC